MSPHKVRRDAIKHGYRSGFEHKLSDYLKELKCKFDYESIKIQWEDLCYRTYTPDFVLYNGIIIETKGRFVSADRVKHLLIQKQQPDLDIRFVFSNSSQRLNKRSRTTYGMWCERYGFLYADKKIPDEWLEE